VGTHSRQLETKGKAAKENAAKDGNGYRTPYTDKLEGLEDLTRNNGV
jgi:hypothetical protein